MLGVDQCLKSHQLLDTQFRPSAKCKVEETMPESRHVCLCLMSSVQIRNTIRGTQPRLRPMASFGGGAPGGAVDGRLASLPGGDRPCTGLELLAS